jgi:glyoxylase-like metal-dependent hydrolase (beta-lactamase superfamily II)
MDNIIKISLDFVNVFLIKTIDGFILIDTGLPNQWDRLEEQLRSNGCFPGNLTLIIITHADWDHTGNVPALRQKYGARIAMHPGDINQAEHGVLLKRTIQPWLFRIFFLLVRLKRELQRNKMIIPKFKPDILLTDGQNLDEYGLAAKIIHIPGHTPGSIGVITEKGDLFAGDTFVNNSNPSSARIVENTEQLENSLDKLSKMNIKTVYPGHGKPFFMDDYIHHR